MSVSELISPFLNTSGHIEDLIYQLPAIKEDPSSKRKLSFSSQKMGSKKLPTH